LNQLYASQLNALRHKRLMLLMLLKSGLRNKEDYVATLQ
jgi:hypothetical protein